MGDRALASRCGPWNRLFATNLTQAQATFVAGGLVERELKNPFAAAANLALFDYSPLPVAERLDFASGDETPNSIDFQFFGTDTAAQTFSARIWGITKAMGVVGTTKVETWKPTLIAQLLLTLGAAQGIANTLVVAADFYVKTHALTFGAAGDVAITDATDLRGGHVRVDFLGFPMIGVELDDGASAVTVNGLYRFLW